MANHPSAQKRVRRNAARAVVNGNRRGRVRTFLKKVEAALAGGDKNAAVAAMRVAQPELQRAVSKGIFHKNTAARKMSRLSARIKALSPAA